MPQHSLSSQAPPPFPLRRLLSNAVRGLYGDVEDPATQMVARLNTLDHEIENDDSRCSADARQMKNELEGKEHLLSTVEKEAADFLNNAEQRLQDAKRKTDEETQACAGELLQLMESVAEYREFMEASIAQRKKELNETADYIASLPSKMSSSRQTSDT